MISRVLQSCWMKIVIFRNIFPIPLLCCKPFVYVASLLFIKPFYWWQRKINRMWIKIMWYKKKKNLLYLCTFAKIREPTCNTQIEKLVTINICIILWLKKSRIKKKLLEVTLFFFYYLKKKLFWIKTILKKIRQKTLF